LKSVEIPKLFTVRDILQNGDPPTARNSGGGRREAGLSGQTGMDGHFHAFTFVNRITAIQPGTSVRGNYSIPPGH
jgi:hypothetical protein